MLGVARRSQTYRRPIGYAAPTTPATGVGHRQARLRCAADPVGPSVAATLETPSSPGTGPTGTPQLDGRAGNSSDGAETRSSLTHCAGGQRVQTRSLENVIAWTITQIRRAGHTRSGGRTPRASQSSFAPPPSISSAGCSSCGSAVRTRPSGRRCGRRQVSRDRCRHSRAAGGLPAGAAMNRISAVQYSAGLFGPNRLVTLQARGRRTGPGYLVPAGRRPTTTASGV
jgi:hypothetical protein